MKKIIVVVCILVLLILVGCNKAPECDYSGHEATNNDLTTKNTKLTTDYSQCLEDKILLSADLIKQKNTNTDLRKIILDQSTTTSCTTCTKMLNSCENRLNECWLHNTTQDGACPARLDECFDVLRIINDTLS